MTTPPKFPSLAALADQTDPQVIRRVLLESLDCVVEMSATRVREMAKGGTYDDPDHAGIVRAVELAARITGAIGVDPVVLLQFKTDTEKLVRRAASILRERETRVLPAAADDSTPE